MSLKNKNEAMQSLIKSSIENGFVPLGQNRSLNHLDLGLFLHLALCSAQSFWKRKRRSISEAVDRPIYEIFTSVKILVPSITL